MDRNTINFAARSLERVGEFGLYGYKQDFQLHGECSRSMKLWLHTSR